MSISERLTKIEQARKMAMSLIGLCEKSPILKDVLIVAMFSRKEITQGEFGLDVKAILENLSLLNYSKNDIERVISKMKTEGYLLSFQWRQRKVYDFAYKNDTEVQNVFLGTLKESQFIQNQINQIQRKAEKYLTKRIKEEKDQEIASVLRLLYQIALPEIGVYLETGGIATFHFKSICGAKWLYRLSELIKNGIVGIRLNFLSTNPAFEYFIPEYIRNTVSSYITYSNIILKQELESLIKPPLFSENFEIPQKHKEILFRYGLCYRKWTTPKVVLTTEYVPTDYMYKIFIEEITEIPEMIVKSYSDDELWTYYLISKALINAKQNIHICSPYVDHTIWTFFIRAIPKNIEVKLLTSRTGGKEKERAFIKVLQRFWKSGYRIEVIKILREGGKVPLHDRYLIQDNRFVIDLPGDFKKGFSGRSKDEDIKWIPFEDKVANYNARFNKYWNLVFEETDFDMDASPFLATKLSYVNPDSLISTRIEIAKGKVRREEKSLSLEQYTSERG